MTQIVERKMLVPNIHLLTVDAPLVANKIQPGQFVIIQPDETGERIPLTVADNDPQAGTVSCVLQEVGASTHKLAQLQAGEELYSFTGPLGRPFELAHFGRVLLAAGCYGIGGLYPLAKALKKLDNHVSVIMEARGAFLLYWLERYQNAADEVLVATFDGSKPGRHINGPDYLAAELGEGQTYDRVFAIGCTFMMSEIARQTRPFNTPTIVSLNPIMVDGTGMCGACRVVVGGQTRFACVDGPAFDAHQVDWDIMLSRRKPYMGEETRSAEHAGGEHHGC
jgi:ferredoxin/flavodoxin---NADP+ reductase